MRMGYHIPVLLLGSILLAPLSLSAWAAPAAEAAEAGHGVGVVEVKIFNVAFEPETVTVSPGTTVRWVNRDPLAHDVTSGTAVTGRRARQVEKTRFPDGRFQSGVFGKGKAFEKRFSEKGTFRYYCNIHPIMQAVVIVE